MEMRNRWKWAGIVVIDDQGNTMAWQMTEPIGTVSVEQDIERGRVLDGSFFTLPPMETRIRVSFEGRATHDWHGGEQAAPDDADLRNVGLIGHPQAGKTLLGNDVKGLTQKPYQIEGDER